MGKANIRRRHACGRIRTGIADTVTNVLSVLKQILSLVQMELLCLSDQKSRLQSVLPACATSQHLMWKWKKPKDLGILGHWSLNINPCPCPIPWLQAKPFLVRWPAPAILMIPGGHWPAWPKAYFLWATWLAALKILVLLVAGNNLQILSMAGPCKAKLEICTPFVYSWSHWTD